MRVPNFYTEIYAPRSHMCFEKQHVWWLLETHVAFRGEDGQRIFVITGFHHPHPEPVTTQAAANRLGC